MKVHELVDCTDLITTNAEKSLGDACDLMKSHNISGIPVISSQGSLQGLISIGQVLHFAHDGVEERKLVDPDWHSPVRAQPARGVWRTMSVENAMVKNVVTVSTDDEIRLAAQKLLNEGVHRAVVIDHNGKPVGMLTTFDFTRYVASS